jgi:prepilin-type processing-associated H-X9-DG protein
MKLRVSNQKTAALTPIEVVVVFVVIAVLALIILPAFYGGPHHPPRINCTNNLKQIGLAYRIWADDHEGKYPLTISVANGGTTEPVVVFQIMSNILSTPKILVCPSDADRVTAKDFQAGFSAKNISYFVGLDADTNHPQALLSGDDNFEISSVPVKSGLLQFSTDTPIAWTTARHNRAGNIGLADGSVQMLSNSGLTNWLHQTGLATNRLAIP